MLEKLKTNNNIQIPKILKNRIVLIAIILLSTICIMFYFNYKMDMDKISYAKNTLNIIIILFTVGITGLSLYIHDKEELKVENVFLILAIIFCSLFCLVMPMSKGHDETVHAIRVYDYAQGNLISNGTNANLPKGIANAINDKPKYSDILNNKETFDSNTSKEYFGYRVSTYSPITYMPQIIGINIGKIITNNAMIQAYMARIFNIISCIAMIYFAIKIIPFGKNILLLISLIPIAVEGYSTISADGMALASSILFISYVLKLIYDQNVKVGKKQIIILTVMSTIVAISKTIYLPIVLLTFLIPKEKYKNTKSKIIQNTLIFGVSAIIDLVWYKIGISGGTGVSNVAIEYILSNPIGYIQKIIYTIFSQFSTYINEMFGGALEWNETVKIQVFPYILLITLIALTTRKRQEKTEILNRISNKGKLLTILIILSVILLIFTAMFIGWSKIDTKYINGIQGRYFLPLLPLIIILFEDKIQDKKNITNKISTIILIMQIFVILNIFITHI